MTRPLESSEQSSSLTHDFSEQMGDYADLGDHLASKKRICRKRTYMACLPCQKSHSSCDSGKILRVFIALCCLTLILARRTSMFKVR